MCRIDHRIKYCAKLIGKAKWILDIGSGNSPYRKIFDYENYISADIEHYPEVDVICDATSLPFDNGKFDAIICTEVLEHLEAPEKALCEISRVLKPGGYLITSIPFMFGKHTRYDYVRWSDLGIKKLLNNHSLNIIWIENRGKIFSMMAELVRQLPAELLGPFSRDSNNFFKYGILFLYYLLIIPITILLRNMDNYVKNDNITIGYILIGQKEEILDVQKTD